MDTHIGASQFKFRNSGGQLQLALNEELCVEVDGSKLHLAKCATGRFGQEFVLDGALTFGKSCLMLRKSFASCGSRQSSRTERSWMSEAVEVVQPSRAAMAGGKWTAHRSGSL